MKEPSSKMKEPGGISQEPGDINKTLGGIKNPGGIPSVYDYRQVETKWYDFWMEKGYFTAQPFSGKPPYTIVIPPPNVTGSLHIGHALNNGLQDVLIRYHRMKGYETLWLPGTDHASIGTHVKIEQALEAEGTNRFALGREKFMERAWDWKNKYGDTIINQLKRLGCSCDWSRTRFTMEEALSRAVLEAFVRLYNEGLIYRGDYITNWCPECRTVISDLEVEHQEVQGNLWYVSYPYEDGNGSITVATTRPETILGDTAVAVNPQDDRYRGAVGRYVILPVLGRRMPVIADSYVDMEFGSGAVKVTPSHDPNDFDMGLRHNLPRVTVIGPDGRMTKEAGPYEGMDRYECRKAILADLEERGNLVKTETHIASVGTHERCDTVVEPLVSTQWFVHMKPLAAPAIEAVRNGFIKFVPERFTKIYMNWMENIRPWCISRQLWWGHRIPAYYCNDCDELVVSAGAPVQCPKCGGTMRQDEDVLDTWFSSALWPYSTLGWPQQTPELAYFYPTSVLLTAYDIIFFWVARMIFTGLHFMGEKPFSTVLLTGLILDKHGKKMSRSKGTGTDPLELIEELGADAVRFGLIAGSTMGNDSRLHRDRFEASRNFCNKIWNASRFVLTNLGGFEAGAGAPAPDLADRWILSRMGVVISEASDLIERFEPGEAAKLLYDFIWSEFCDWYIELSKPKLSSDNKKERQTAQYVLWFVLEHTLKLLHPFMPFITEEIWQALPHEGESIMVSPWPSVTWEIDRDAILSMTYVMDTTRAIRNLRAELAIPPSRKVRAIVHSAARATGALKALAAYMQRLANLETIELRPEGSPKPPKALTSVVPGVEVFLPFEGLIDVDKERGRLAKGLGDVETELERVEKRLADQGFVKRAPEEVVQKEQGRRAELFERAAKLRQRIEELSR